MQTPKIIATAYHYYLSQAIYVAAQLNIADYLKCGPVSLPELYTELSQAHPALELNLLYRLLRNLTAVGIFQQRQQTFSLGRLGQELLHAKSRRYICQALGPENWQAVVNCGLNGEFKHYAMVFAQPESNLSAGLAQLVLAFQRSKALYLFVRYELAEILTHGPRSLTALAAQAELEPGLVAALCQQLCDSELLVQDHKAHFALTATGQLLSGQHPNSWQSFVLHENPAKWRAAGMLYLAMTQGKQAFSLANEHELFNFLQLNHAEKVIFNQAMAQITRYEVSAIASKIQLPNQIRSIMDVGGASGTLVKELLKHCSSNVQGIVFDLPQALHELQIAEPNIRKQEGDFFKKKTLPRVDVVWLKRVLHDWPNAKAIEILRNCAEKCQFLYVFEWLWQDNSPLLASLDFALMTIGGKIRSEQEMQDMLTTAGLELQSKIEVMEGVFAIQSKPLSCMQTLNPYRQFNARDKQLAEQEEHESQLDLKPC